jgi:hypothetical protein
MIFIGCGYRRRKAGVWVANPVSNAKGKAVPWLRRLIAGLSPWRPDFVLRSVHVGFVVDIAVVGQVRLRFHLFSPVSIIPPWLSILNRDARILFLSI